MIWQGKSRRIWPVILGFKADLAATVKLGQLTRNHLRDTPSTENGPGICHLCRGGQLGHPWHKVSFAAMSAAKQDLEPPWESEPALILHTPQCPTQKHEFFRLDLFHCAHKGLWGDMAANTLAP